MYNIKGITVYECPSCMTRFDTEPEAYECSLTHLTNEQRVADALHDAFCHRNHDDVCDWFYGSWDNLTWSRREYIKKAGILLEYTREYMLDPIELITVMKKCR